MVSPRPVADTWKEIHSPGWRTLEKRDLAALRELAAEATSRTEQRRRT